MKFFETILTIIFIFGFCKAHAENWFPVGKQNAKTIWVKKDRCEQVEGQACYDITGKDLRFHEPITQMVDDQSKPIMKPPYNATNCDSDADCELKRNALECSMGDYPTQEKNEILPGWTLACTGITGYQQKEETVLVENADLKAQVQFQDQAKNTLESQIQARTKRIGFGTRIVALMGVRNDAKNLTAEQSAGFLSTYGPIMQMLQAGALDTAKAQIEAITPDGTITTQADKDAILSEINAFLGQ